MEKKVIWKNPNGEVVIFAIPAWTLCALQRGRSDYDPTEHVARMRSAGVSERWVQIALHGGLPIDLEEYEARLRSQGMPEAVIQADMAYQEGVLNGGKTFEEAVQIVARKSCSSGGTFMVVDADQIQHGKGAPLRDFHHALDFDVNGLKWDMAKCRELERQKRRQLRLPKMAELDVLQKRALVANDRARVSAIEDELQRLRDAPADPAIDAATTPEALLASRPEELS